MDFLTGGTQIALWVLREVPERVVPERAADERAIQHLSRSNTMKASLITKLGLCLVVGCSLTHSSEAAGLLVADGGFGGVLKIEEHDVRVTINNGIAVTRVTQVFRNTEDRQLEALYTFPVPQGASVSNFSMWINGKEMVGEVLEKKRARKIYESYKQTRRDPGLLEQTDYKTFEMRIFPIAGGAKQRVEITYYQELNFDHDRVTYVYPLATTTRRGLDSRTTGKFALTLEAKSEIPIVATDSPSHADDFVIVNHTPAYVQASLETRQGDLNRDVVLSYAVARPHTGMDIITSKPAEDDGYLCLTVTAGEELNKPDQGMDYVFILDISGSMGHDGKMRLSRESIAAFIDELGDQDRFEVIAFNVAPSKLFGQLTPWTDDSRQQSQTFLSSQQARGGTVLHPAVTTAYQYGDPDRQLNVIILSDGMTEQQERSELLQLITARPSNAKVFCIGVGNEVNRPLLNQLATDAGGLASFISHGDNFPRQAQAFRRKLTRPVASDVRIRFEGVDVYDVVPQVLPNLYHGSPVRLYARYRGAGPAEVRIEAEVNGTALNQAITVELPRRNDDNPEIERMWAWHKIDRLSTAARPAGNDQSVIDDIVALGEEYSIVTQHTSFIVLENDAEYRRWKIDRRNLLRIARDRQAQSRTTEKLARLRKQALSQQTALPTAKPQPAAVPQPAPSNVPVARRDARPVPVNAPAAPRSNRGFDINVPNLGGGGAFDPITGMLVLSLAGLGLGAGSRRQRT